MTSHFLLKYSNPQQQRYTFRNMNNIYQIAQTNQDSLLFSTVESTFSMFCVYKTISLFYIQQYLIPERQYLLHYPLRNQMESQEINRASENSLDTMGDLLNALPQDEEEVNSIVQLFSLWSAPSHVPAELSAANKQFDQLMHALTNPHRLNDLTALKKTFCKLMALARYYPRLIKPTERKTLIFKIACQLISQIPFNHQSSWTDSASEKNRGEEKMQLSLLDEINRFGALIGWELTRNFARQLFNPNFYTWIPQGGDQKQQGMIYASLVISSSLSFKTHEIDQVEEYIEQSKRYLTHLSPKIRWAALKLLGKIAADLKLLFQDIYGEQVLPTVIQLLKDNFKKVSNEAYQCLAYICQKMSTNHYLHNYIPQIYNIIEHHLNEGSVCTKKAVLNLIKSLGSTSKVLGKYATKLVKQCLCAMKIERSHSIVQAALIAASTIICYQRQPAIPVQLKGYFVHHYLKERNRLGPALFLQLWKLLGGGCPEIIILEKICPQLMQDYLQMLLKFKYGQGKNMLNCLMSTFDNFNTVPPFFVDSIVGTLKMNIFSGNENYVSQAIEALIKLTKSFGEGNQNYFFMVNGKETIDYLMDRIDTILQEDYSPVISVYIESVTNVLGETIQYLQEDDITEIALRIKRYFGILLQLKIHSTPQQQKWNGQNPNHEGNVNGNSQEEEEDYENMNQKKERLLLASIAEQSAALYSKILDSVNVNQNARKFYADLIIEDMKNIFKHKMFITAGLNLAIILLKKCSYQILSDHWPYIYNVLSAHIASPKANIRKLAVYGFGVIIRSTPLQFLNAEQAETCVQFLYKAYKVPYKDSELLQSIKIAQQNVISAFGKVIKHVGSEYPEFVQHNFESWFAALPLNYDIEEGNEQQAIFLDLVENIPTIFEFSCMAMSKICRIFISFTMRRREGEHTGILEQTKRVMKALATTNFYLQSAEQLWKQLNQSQRNTLTWLLN